MISTLVCFNVILHTDYRESAAKTITTYSTAEEASKRLAMPLFLLKTPPPNYEIVKLHATKLPADASLGAPGRTLVRLDYRNTATRHTLYVFQTAAAAQVDARTHFLRAINHSGLRIDQPTRNKFAVSRQSGMDFAATGDMISEHSLSTLLKDFKVVKSG